MTTLTRSVLSGTDFKKTFSGPFYKFLNNDYKHHNFTYNLGLNVDNEQFNPIGECQKGGLYFCELDKCHLYYSGFGNYLARIDVPDNAKVYIETDKFKADRLIVSTITHFDNVPIEFWIKLLKYDGFALQFIKEQTEEICKMAVQQNSNALNYVKKQTEEICKMAVQQNSNALNYVKKQTEEICKLAVQQYGLALVYVKNQTKEICKLAVQQNGLALDYVKNQTEEICKLAVQQNGLALDYVKNQTEEICKLAVQQN
jgi:phage regulator Rha-like protein